MKSRLGLAVSDLGATQLKNIAEPVRVYSLEVGKAAQGKPTKPAVPKQRSIFVLLGAAMVALIAIAGTAWYFLGANRPATNANPLQEHRPVPRAHDFLSGSGCAPRYWGSRSRSLWPAIGATFGEWLSRIPSCLVSLLSANWKKLSQLSALSYRVRRRSV